jgi:hypothetical protein
MRAAFSRKQGFPQLAKGRETMKRQFERRKLDGQPVVDDAPREREVEAMLAQLRR